MRYYSLNIIQYTIVQKNTVKKNTGGKSAKNSSPPKAEEKELTSNVASKGGPKTIPNCFRVINYAYIAQCRGKKGEFNPRQAIASDGIVCEIIFFFIPIY